jgi:hypothetical protein
MRSLKKEIAVQDTQMTQKQTYLARSIQAQIDAKNGRENSEKSKKRKFTRNSAPSSQQKECLLSGSPIDFNASVLR